MILRAMIAHERRLPAATKLGMYAAALLIPVFGATWAVVLDRRTGRAWRAQGDPRGREIRKHSTYAILLCFGVWIALPIAFLKFRTWQADETPPRASSLENACDGSSGRLPVSVDGYVSATGASPCSGAICVAELSSTPKLPRPSGAMFIEAVFTLGNEANTVTTEGGELKVKTTTGAVASRGQRLRLIGRGTNTGRWGMCSIRVNRIEAAQ